MTIRQPTLREAHRQIARINRALTSYRRVFDLSGTEPLPSEIWGRYQKRVRQFWSDGVCYQKRRGGTMHPLRFPVSLIDRKCDLCQRILRDGIEGFSGTLGIYRKSRFRIPRTERLTRGGGLKLTHARGHEVCLTCWNKHRRPAEQLRHVVEFDLQLRKLAKEIQHAEG